MVFELSNNAMTYVQDYQPIGWKQRESIPLWYNESEGFKMMSWDSLTSKKLNKPRYWGQIEIVIVD